MSGPRPTSIVMHQASRVLEVGFDTGEVFRLPAEYLRVESPSAEVQGHGPSQKILVGGKRNVNVMKIESVGQYAILLRFNDGHDTGIYSWRLLHELGREQAERWDKYLAAMAAAGMER
ncbi:MAG: gamma-butyrobetaine hydroxylase-like domain-containing protein [Pseudomarimonas sp.]